MTDALTITRSGIVNVTKPMNRPPARRSRVDGLIGAGGKLALLLMLRQGPLEWRGGRWVARDGTRVQVQSFDALFDRRLVYIAVESRHRRRHSGFLTEIGRHVANDLARQAEVSSQIAGNVER